MNPILVSLVILPMLSPFDPPPGPLPVQPPEFPDLDVVSTPEVPDFDQPEVSAAYAAKLAETQDKLDSIEASLASLDETTGEIVDLLPTSDGSDSDIGLTDDNGDPMTAIEYANSTQSSLAAIFAYIRLALYFSNSLTGTVFQHMLRAALWLLTLFFILLALQFLLWLFRLLIEVIGWLKPVLELLAG